jgi:hypothetical protein
MAPGSLTVGNINSNFGGGTTGWNTNTAGLLLETLDNTEIAVHDSGKRLASLMYYEGGDVNRITIGRQMDPSWGAISTLALNGNVGIGTKDPPKHLLEIGASVNGIAFQGSDGSPNAGYIRFGDGTGWKLHFGQSQTGATVYKGLDGVRMTLQDKGNVGIGTTDPAALLDVNGRILRKGQDFSVIGVAGNGATINPPWGTNADWNIYVSPNTMGEEEAGSEGDNALLMTRCWAEASGTGWLITASYKYKWGNANNQNEWRNGKANYLLLPK